MKKFLFALLLYTAVACQVEAQYSFSFSGYAIDLPIFQSNRESTANFFQTNKNQFLNLFRTRLRPTLYLWQGARISAEYEIAALYYESLSNLSLNQEGKGF